MSYMKNIKLEQKRGIVPGIELGDSISRVLSHLSIYFNAYGRIEIINDKSSPENPTFVVVPDSGNFTSHTHYRTQTKI